MLLKLFLRSCNKACVHNPLVIVVISQIFLLLFSLFVCVLIGEIGTDLVLFIESEPIWCKTFRVRLVLISSDMPIKLT